MTKRAPRITPTCRKLNSPNRQGAHQQFVPPLELQRVAAISLSGRDGVDEGDGDGSEKPQAQSSSTRSASKIFLSIFLPPCFFLALGGKYGRSEAYL